MKNLKLLFITLFIALSFSCNNDDDCLHQEPDNTVQTVNFRIAYDGQDNILKINNTGDWLQSMDWNIYVEVQVESWD